MNNSRDANRTAGPGRKRGLPVLGLIAFLAASGRAATPLIEVTTSVDGNPGSLGAALTAANADGAAASNTVFFSPLVSPLLTVGAAPGVAKNAGQSLTLASGSGTNATFTGPLNLSGGGTFNFNGLSASNVTLTGGGVLSLSYGTLTGLTLTASTLQTLGNSVASGVTLFGSNVIDVAGNTPVVSNIGGAGALTVMDSIGNGTLSLSGVNGYTGGTTVNSGTLQLAAANAAGGGTLAVNAGGVFDLNGFNQTLGNATNAGTIKTGVGALTAANYSGAGTLAVALKPGVTNLNVAGTATLTGGTLSVVGRPGVGVYTIVNAGTLAGTFTSIFVPLGVTDTFIYSGTSLIMDILNDTPFTLAGQSSNQTSVGAALNVANTAASADLNAVVNQLIALTPAQLNAALDQIGPVAFSALSGMSFAGSGVQSAAVRQRMSGLQAGTSNSDGGRVAYYRVSGPSPYPGTLVAELPGDASAAYAGEREDGPRSADSPWGFFASGLGTLARLDSRNGASGYQPGYSVTAYGATMGADYRVNENFAAGFTGGYVNSFAGLDSNAGSVFGQSVRFGAYGTVYDDELHANLYLGGAHDFYDTSRSISALSRTATAKPSGNEFNMDASVGEDLKTAHLTVSPFASLSYDRLMVGGFTESGAGALDLGVAPQAVESLRSGLGAKFSRRFKLGTNVFTPYASAGWQHEFENQSRPIAAQLASGGTGTFTVNTADAARDGALLGAGLNMDWSDDFSTRLAYAGDVRSDFNAKTFSGSLRLRF